MVRTYASIPGKNQLEAIDLANQTFGIEAAEQAPVEDQNNQALAELEAFMRGVK